MSIELTLSHRRFWWQIDEEDANPESWHVSADITPLDPCQDELRHVADIELAIADLGGERNLLDSVTLGEWALEFIAETVIDPRQGKLHPALDAELDPGPPRMVVLRHVALTPLWRGHGLGAALIASALRILAPDARLAVCRISPLDFAQCHDDRLARELAASRVGGMLERIGFRRWRDVHVIGLRDPALLETRMKVLDLWWPSGGKAGL
ncbi:hypothetical protein HFP15_31710 [Amycolatopsis sp. K13G38]|uniref:GNAT family N-acetyltransferase n=1 Tax=Amycolatopsis acididurans TaxID=2724524 RepID=A0ABX1JCH3_9PSEU|nr:hypothetical protein [Amycolatopsis acididurans]NKQ57441.1 hypothetical protein [Amycolatopsis acididurans]